MFFRQYYLDCLSHASYQKSVGAAAAPVATALVRVDPMTVLKVVVAGTIVGLLTGFFGVRGGFVIVPALVLAHCDEPPSRRRRRGGAAWRASE